jgi:hypothetical protein
MISTSPVSVFTDLIFKSVINNSHENAEIQMVQVMESTSRLFQSIAVFAIISSTQ